MENIVILGSTGSIGTQALDIIRNSNKFRVVGLSCGDNIEKLEEQIEEFKPLYCSTRKRCKRLESKYPEIVFMYGEEALEKMAYLEEADTVLNSLVGSCGLLPTLSAIRNKKKVLLSNKETLVIGGELVKEYLRKCKGTLYPIDSEHSSIWELLDKYGSDVSEITITASGGPFRDYDIKDLENVTVEDTLNHPNWKMGKKITVDSATMMNKGFEVIEAYHLFNYPLDKIKTIINMESLVHSIVTLKGGKTIYGIDRATMENPIRRALFYPEITYEKTMYDEEMMHFREIDPNKYPCLKLAYIAQERGGVNPAILNAANESAVKLFLDGKIKFTEIYKINKETMDEFETDEPASLENILKYDKQVKKFVIKKYGR